VVLVMCVGWIAATPVSIQNGQFSLTVTTNPLNNMLIYQYFTADLPTWQYTISLKMVFEAAKVNGNFVPVNPMVPLLPAPTITKQINPTNITITAAYGQSANGFDSLDLLQFVNVFPTNGTVCPDANGRFCVKSTHIFQYNRLMGQNMDKFMVFVWDFKLNNITATSTMMNPVTTPTYQVVNNLGFYNIEPLMKITDLKQNNLQFERPVTVEVHTDNFTTMGIWVVYDVTQLKHFHVNHDPTFGINRSNVGLTIEAVTIALAVGIVLAFLVVLVCAIYIYHGNTKEYYLELRLKEDLE